MATRPTYRGALRAALAGLAESTRDKAAVRLAYGYAERLDTEPGSVDKVGPLLLACLEALLLTPRARVVAMKGAKDERPTRSPVDELRARRAARANRTQDLDATAS